MFVLFLYLHLGTRVDDICRTGDCPMMEDVKGLHIRILLLGENGVIL
jgi:hypothetical protein